MKDLEGRLQVVKETIVHAIVIDDSRAMRSIISNILRKKGIEVTEAVNGRDALTKLRASDPPSVALLDWNMPEMNGYDLLRRIRANRAFDSMQIVMVTTETEVSQMVRALEAGANEYIMKPFSSEVILEKLHMLGITEPQTSMP